jgi:hypothetical protein
MPPPQAGPVIVQRRVSQRGSIMVATQRVHVGMIHAREVVTGTAGEHSFQISLDGEVIAVVPRATTREIRRCKVYATGPRGQASTGQALRLTCATLPWPSRRTTS